MISVVADQVTITFTTPFVYNGTDNLIVAVDENGSGYDGNSDEFLCSSVSSNRALTYRSDSNNPDPSGVLPSGLLRTAIPNIQFIGISQACPDPSSLSVTNLVATSADLAWTENGTATAWNIEYGATGFTQGAGTTVAASNNPHNLSSLTANTTYDFYVQADCGGGDLSAWAGPFSFSTPCVAFNLPYFEGFENGYAHNADIDGCLSQESVSGSGNWTANETNTAYNRSPYSGNWNTTLIYGNTDWMFIQVNLVGGTSYTADVYARQDGSTTSNASISISYGSANNAASMTNSIAPSTGLTNGTYQLVNGIFTPASSGVYYIGIKGEINGSPWYISLDDISIYESPSCLPPSALTATNMTATSADLAWTENGTATAWNVEYGATGFTQGSGTTVAASSNPLPLSGLTANTAYDFYVQANCGGGDLSPWIGPFNFTTLCTAVSAPWTYDVETATTTTSSEIEDCWSSNPSYTSTAFAWNIGGSTSSAGTGPDSPNSGSKFFYTEASNGITLDEAFLYTPSIDLTSLTVPVLGFYYHMYGSNMGSLSVQVSSDNGATWTTEFNLSGQQQIGGNEAWISENIVLSAYSGTVKVRFKGVRGAGYAGDIALDDISVFEAPSCIAPSALTATNITATSADLAWTENGTATAWNVEYGATGFTQGAGTTFAASSNPLSLSGLTANTAYDFYVQADCGGSGLSSWAGPFSFSTPCVAFNLPYFEGFENGYAHDADIDGCLSQESVSGSGSWTANETNTTYNRSPYSGNWNTTLRYGNTDWMFIPINLVGGTSYTADVYARQDGSTTSNASISISYGSANDAASMTNSIVPSTGLTNGTYQLVNGIFTPASSGVYYIGIKGEINGSPWYISLDDISIYESPSCLPPSALTATNLTATSANLAWTENGTATAWNVEYGVSGFTQGSGTTVAASSNPYALSGLTATTPYDFYVQANCGGGDLSPWVGPFNFTTPCAAEIPDYSTDFSSFLPSCWEEAGAGSPATGPSSLGTGYWGQSGSSARINLYSNSREDWLLTPAFDLSAGGYELVLNTNATDWSSSTAFSGMGSDDKLQVVVSTDDGTTWSVIHTWNNANPLLLAANDISIDLSAYTGTNTLFGIWASDGSTSDSEDYYIYINNFEIKTAITCADPSALITSSITGTSADLAWTENGTATTWNVEYGVDGFTQGSGTSVSTTSNPYALTGLSINTAYDFFVQADCGLGDESAWVGPFSFSTLCVATAGTDVQVACNSYTWIDGNTYTSSNNSAMHTLTNVAGCDSVVTLDLTINNSNTGTDVQVACDSYTWIDGVTYTASNNVAMHTLTNVAGCDSVVTLDLTINNSTTGTDTQVACDSYTWIDGVTYLASNNVATHTLSNAAGCDSVVTLDLTINNSNTGTDVQVACDSYTWIDGVTYIASNNVATHTLTNTAGCDSVVTLDLTINNSNTGTDVITACDSYTWIDGVTYLASNNVATHTLSNAAGCDSVVTLDLTINNSNTGTDVQVACDSYTWIDGVTYTASNNVATHTLSNAAGCDSVVTLDLTINNSNTGTDVITACDSYTWIDGVTYLASNNVATHTLTNAAGCDSVVTLDLTINNSTTGTDTQVACDSYTWIDGVTYLASNNVATHTLTNVAGCDSVVTLDLTLNYSNTGTDVQVACDSYTWIDGNTYTASNNSAMHTLTNAAGCDSIVTLDLTVNNAVTGTDTRIACTSLTWI
ncbi:fibronectin type III domain-containing protein, partial [Brumimicrobium oceani]